VPDFALAASILIAASSNNLLKAAYAAGFAGRRATAGSVAALIGLAILDGQRGYRFKQAEAKAQAGQAIRSKPRKLTAPLRGRIEAKLRQMRWSPEQISGWLCEQGINLSHECIYQMIWHDKRDGGDLWRSLRRRGKRYKNVPARTPGPA
jgi:hypothetical protein